MASLLSTIGAVGPTPCSRKEAFAKARCEGKHGYPTAQAATEVTKRIRTKGRNRRNQEHYRCQECGLYHLGSPK